jgi:chromosome segregation ATPase
MHLLATPFTFFQIAIFLIALIAFLLTVRFFIASQKRLENLLPRTKNKKNHFRVGLDRDGFIVPAGKDNKKQVNKLTGSDEETKNELKELRGMLQLQQLELTRAVNKIADLSSDKKSDDDYERYVDEEEEEYSSAPNMEIEQLRLQLEKKEAELTEIRRQEELSHKLQGHFEEVQSGYEELQVKVHKMEQQAWQAAELAIKVDSLEQSNEQLEATVIKKEERLRELTLENGRLHELLNETEDKLSEANLQRQQLNRKVQFLEEINNDIQQMSDANRKLKNELRRVAELESMLNLITEERDALLKRRSTKF